MKELYHEEQKVLSDYVGKVKNKDLSMDDAVGIAVNYKDLLDQSKVITRISDRLQKKLDNANQKIKSQNTEIQKKNTQLGETIVKLDKMTIGKKVLRMMWVLGFLLVIAEELFLAPILEEAFGNRYVIVAAIGLIAMLMKLSESRLEGHFLKQKKKQILGANQPESSSVKMEDSMVSPISKAKA
ncbi:MAG: hypothetical protein JXR07_04070 [Reichenbachiella sp.]